MGLRRMDVHVGSLMTPAPPVPPEYPNRKDPDNTYGRNLETYITLEQKKTPYSIYLVPGDLPVLTTLC